MVFSGVFFACDGLGQELPIWENNVYLYNRFTIGKDFQNVNNLLIQKDGQYRRKPYAKPV